MATIPGDGAKEAPELKESQQSLPLPNTAQNATEPAAKDATEGEAAAAAKAGGTAPAVRFKSTIEEIAPDVVVPAASAASGASELSAQDRRPSRGPSDGEEVTPEQIRALSASLQGSHLQGRRANIFQFEAFSLPASRTPSHEESSREASRQHTRSSGVGADRSSPHLSPRVMEMQTPPLTPAVTDSTTSEPKTGDEAQPDRRGRHGPRHDLITPQDSTQHPSPSASSQRLGPRHLSSEEVTTLRKSHDLKEHGGLPDHRRGLFGVGPSSDSGSQPGSRDSSPSRQAPASQYYSRPLTPSGDANDPYAAAKRAPQNKGKIESRFVFSLKKRGHSPGPSRASDKRHSGLFNHDDGSNATIHQSEKGSMADLKRFFKIGAHHKGKRAASPAPSARTGARTPLPQRNSTVSVQMPFDHEHGLSSKYGKLGKVLGAGAGGSVRLMKRSEDNTVFAVKEFRPRHTHESEKEYVKKLTAEYCIGSSLHHGNVIETLDIVQEKGRWYEVMEYAPYDLFAIVMTGRMSRQEISCCFLQILSGVTYLHSIGLAHRDLKLDNVVVSEKGILKIIDFGSAHVFKYPFESTITKASGIVGSDPYLAPEVYDEKKYDPAAVDIWSLGIIFCCMTLRRFPWKVPRLTDTSYKLFAAEPTPGHDPKKLALPPSQSTSALTHIVPRDVISEPSSHATSTAGENKPAPSSRSSSRQRSSSRPPSSEKPATSEATDSKDKEKKDDPNKKEIIRGPWRILRLLPRESRHVIGRMLEINPRERITMEDILLDPWVADTVICRQVEPGVVISGEDHTHVLEPPQSTGA